MFLYSVKHEADRQTTEKELHERQAREEDALQQELKRIAEDRARWEEHIKQYFFLNVRGLTRFFMVSPGISWFFDVFIGSQVFH